MKARNIIGLAVAALTFVPAAVAQDAAGDKPASPKLKAVVLMPNSKKLQELEIERSDGKDNFFYIEKSTVTEMQMPVASCKPFVLQTPADLAAAVNSFREGDIAAARKKCAAVKTKYANYAGLPGSPVTIAGITEINCAVRMQDWAALKTLVAEFPSADALTGADAMCLKVAAIMADISDSPKSLDTQKAAIEELLKDKKAAKAINSEMYGWLRYALARANAAKLTEEDLNGTIPEDKVKFADAAIDNFCQCVAATHGIAPELPVDSLKRAMTILYAMPGVKDYKPATPMTKQTWANAPANFKDAVAMANLLKLVYAPDEKIELADKLAPFYYNTGKDKPKKDAAPAEEGK